MTQFLNSGTDDHPLMTQDFLTDTIADLLTSATRAAVRDVAPDAADTIEAAAGAHAVIAHRGQVVAEHRCGYALLHDVDGVLLPSGDREALTTGPVFDIASLTKPLVAATALTEVRTGRIALSDRVAQYLPGFSSGRSADVTIAHLLTHTSGLPAVSSLWRVPGTRADRVQALLRTPLQAAPGTEHTYSCVGYQVLGVLLEQVTGHYLPALIDARVTGPLSMSDTGYAPTAAGSVAATEYQQQPERGLVRGQVHDEAAWSLGGAGNAGVFGTAGDMLRFGEAVRTAADPLDEQIRTLMYTDSLTAVQREQVGYGQAVGFRVAQQGFMGSMPHGLVGHTGFTGTSLVIDPARELTMVLFTNRVHPYRSVFEVTALRRGLVDAAQRWVDSI